MNHGRRIRRLPALHLTDLPPGVPDADLLARWVAHRDEAAFELLVRRHAPAVLAACRRLLADPNDADDAFQAAFLVLARKAASVARGEALAAWLHRIACRTAARLRADRTRRADRHAGGAVDHLPAPPPADPSWAELLRVLDEEVERLPARHRAAFVLCCLEGKTGEEAGRLLGCPPGTVSSRLTRAHERLRDRLTRRGFAPAALLVAALTGDAIAVPVPNALVAAITRGAPAFRAGRPAPSPPTRPAAVAQGVVNAMLAQKLTPVAALLVAGLLAAGAVLAGAAPDPTDGPATRPPAVAKGAADDKAAADPNGPPDPKRPPAAPVVRLVRPQAGGLDRVAVQRCVVQAGREAHLFPTAVGVLTRVDARIGDRVKAGQLLAEIDAPALALDERLAAVGVEQSEGLLKEGEARVATAKAEVDAAAGVVRLRQSEAAGARAASGFRKKQLDRVKELAKQGTVDQKAVDEADEQHRAAEGLADGAAVGADNAKADLVVKESKREQAAAGVGTARANVAAAKIGLDKARLAVAQTRVVAPFDGIVAEATAAPGQFVRAPGERADPTPLFTVMRGDILRVVASVPGRDAGRFEPGLAVEVTIDALPDATAAGRVARVGFAVEPPHGTVRAEIDLTNPKGIIRPGMTGEVSVKLGKGPADAVRVPAGAVIQVTPARKGDPGTAVYIYKDGKARLTPVRVGYQDEKEVEVAAGLSAADLVVADPKGLVPQAEVTVEVEKAAPPK